MNDRGGPDSEADVDRRSVCVFCASSERADPVYRDVAHRLGALLARSGRRVVYGGGATGSMGALADGALSGGGEVLGVLPKFMADLEWGHPGLSELRLVEDMRIRKHILVSESDAVVALPGGCGTFEELLETITLKRLGVYLHPIVLVNTRGYYDPLLAMLDRSIEERFMDERHASMWQVVEEPEAVLGAIAEAPAWSPEARTFAAMHAHTAPPPR